MLSLTRKDNGSHRLGLEAMYNFLLYIFWKLISKNLHVHPVKVVYIQILFYFKLIYLF